MNNPYKKDIPELILVVDDDAAMRLLMRESLEQAGLSVVEAKNGSEALAIFEQNNPDLLLLDVKMPGIDGYAVCEQIRQQDTGKETPIIMITGLEDDESIEKAYQVGATDFITKPVVWTILSHRVRYLLRAGKAFRDLRLNEDRLNQAQRVARMGNWDWDIINDRVHWSQELYRIFKQPLEFSEFTLRECLNFIHPDDLQDVRDMIDSSLINNKAHKMEYRIVSKDGTELTVEHQAELISNDQGVPVRMYGTIQDISERKLAENHIRQLAYYDHLTGLPNRQMFYERLEWAMHTSRREGNKLALIFLDLDRFKEVNDTLGHDAGDELLKNIAQYLTKSIRVSDIVTHLKISDQSRATLSRLGGDEFTIVLPNLKEVDVAAHVCNRVLDQLRLPMKLAGQEMTVTGSMGIAIFPDDGENVDTLLRHSDMAMYHAKQGGKNSFKFFTNSMNDAVKRRMDTESDLQRALDRNEFILQYEPRIEIDSGKIVGVEALIRWNHPTRGLLHPEHFIQIAEETGSISQIGEWVLNAACQTMQNFLQLGIGPIIMTVNLSSEQFKQAYFVETVERILISRKLDARYLELELTETGIIEDSEQMMKTFKKLKEVGVMLSLDNFGTGHSSFAHLRHFPIDTIKIDRSFIAELTTNLKDATIIESIVTLTRGLNLISVAKGVETREQMERLGYLKCNQAQGNLISKSLSVYEIERLLKIDS